MVDSQDCRNTEQAHEDELFHLIEVDKMNTLEDYTAFKDEWYPQMKNR